MINIITQPASESSSDPIKNVKAKLYNAALKGYAEIIKKSHSQIKCSDHPNANQTLKLSSKSDGKVKAEMTSFCCQKFKQQIESSIH